MENLGPYTNFHELNQDWFLQEFNKLIAQWKAMQKNFDNLQDAFNDLKSYVQDYFKNLDVEKTYYFKETKAPQGYRIPVDENGKAYVHSVYVSATPQTNTFDFTIDNVQYNTSKTSGNIRLEGTKNDRVVAVDITNKTTQLLPETGSNGTILLIGLGVAVIAFALYMSKKEKLNSK